MTKLFNFEFTIEHEEMTKAEQEKAEDKLEAVFNEIFGDEWVGTWNWDYKQKELDDSELLFQRELWDRECEDD